MGGKLAKSVTRARGNKKGKKKMDTKTTCTIYYRAEFQTMGDVIKDGLLNQAEFLRLMTLLGLPDVDKAGPILFNKTKMAAGDKMSVDEYVAMMMDPTVDANTNMWRKLFAEFDTDGSGYASRQDVISGLEKLGITVGEETRRRIQAMDSNKDGKIHYGDFLKMQLLNK